MDLRRNQTPRPPTEDLKCLYMDELLSPKHIGKRYEVSAYIVKKWLEETGLYSLRSPYQKRIVPDGDYLYEEYIIKNRSLEEIALEKKTSVSTVLRWLRDEEIFKFGKVAERYFGL